MGESSDFEDLFMRSFAITLGLFSALAVPSACVASTITGVTFSGSAANPTITVTGTGFGTTAPAASSPSALGTGFDYGTSLYFEDHSSNPNPFQAGYQNTSAGQYDTLGLVLLSYGNTSVTYQLGSAYSTFFYPNGIFRLSSGDSFTASVLESTFNGVVSYAAATPEPSGLILMATGLTGLAAAARRKLRPSAVPCEA